MAEGLRYIGGGWVPDIPARDLTEDEVKVAGRESLLSTGLYQEYSPSPGPSGRVLSNKVLLPIAENKEDGELNGGN